MAVSTLFLVAFSVEKPCLKRSSSSGLRVACLPAESAELPVSLSVLHSLNGECCVDKRAVQGGLCVLVSCAGRACEWGGRDCALVAAVSRGGSEHSCGTAAAAHRSAATLLQHFTRAKPCMRHTSVGLHASGAREAHSNAATKRAACSTVCRRCQALTSLLLCCCRFSCCSSVVGVYRHVRACSHVVFEEEEIIGGRRHVAGCHPAPTPRQQQ